MQARTWIGVALALSCLGLGAAAYVSVHAGAPAASARVPLSVVGPGGAPLFDGDVLAEPATPLGALQASGLALAVDRYPGMGEYVRAIDGREARGGSGWIYEVLRDGAWVSGDRSGALFALEPGDTVRWRWVDG